MPVRLSQINIFPLKSFDSTVQNEMRVLPAGCLENDRRFALFDAAGKVVNGKRTPLVHALDIAFNDDHTEITIGEPARSRVEVHPLPGGIERVNKRFSEHFGFPVILRENRQSGFPDDTLSHGPTIIAAETLRTVADWFGISFDDARERFRANLIIEGGGPFWDDHLFSDPGATVTFRIGDVLFFGVNPCARCVVPTRDARSGEGIPGFVNTFTARRRKMLPAWARSEAFDHFYRMAVNTRLYVPTEGGVIRVGDAVEIL